MNKDNALPLNTVKVLGFNDAAEWSSLAENDAPKELKNKNVISLCHTPDSNIGNLSYLFYTEGHQASVVPDVFHHEESHAQGKQECENFVKYLDQHIAPHMLVSISVYEDSHPQKSEGGVNLTMLHTAGSQGEIKPLKERYQS